MSSQPQNQAGKPLSQKAILTFVGIIIGTALTLLGVIWTNSTNLRVAEKNHEATIKAAEIAADATLKAAVPSRPNTEQTEPVKNTPPPKDTPQPKDTPIEDPPRKVEKTPDQTKRDEKTPDVTKVPKQKPEPTEKENLTGKVLFVVVHTVGSTLITSEANDALRQAQDRYKKDLLGGQFRVVDKNKLRTWGGSPDDKDGIEKFNDALRQTVAAAKSEAQATKASNFRVILLLELDGDPGNDAPDLSGNCEFHVIYLHKGSDEDSRSLMQWFPDRSHRLKAIGNLANCVERLFDK